jgi:hypothetical protein
LGWNIRAHYKIITDYCKPDDAGGQSPGEGGYEISYVENNPDTKPASRVARSAKRELNYTLMTIAEAAERRQRAANINAAKAIEKRAVSALSASRPPHTTLTYSWRKGHMDKCR